MTDHSSKRQAMDIPQIVEQGAELHRAGKFTEAAAIYRKVLALRPNHADALHLLGVIDSQTGRRESAVELINRAIAIRPDVADYYDNLGLVFSAMGRTNEAIAAHRRATELNPSHRQAHYNLGNLLHQSGQFDAALAAFRRAVELRPDWAEAIQNLASTLHIKGLEADAETAARRALALRPDFPEAHNTLGAILGATRRFDEAIAELQKAVQLYPNFPSALANLGSALGTAARFDQAIKVLRRAIELNPNLSEAYNNLGIVLKDVGQLQESIAVLQRGLVIRPNAVETITNLGNSFKDCGQIEDAIACWGRALALQPAAPHIHSNLIYTLQFHPAYDDESLLRDQRRWNDLHARPLQASIRPHANDRSPDRRLRIGYVSPYFYSQAETFFVVPLLESHDHRQFEIHSYVDVARPDDLTARLRRSVDVWHDCLGKTDDEIAEQIRRDGIDILVDLAMHMAHNRLLVFARKPAPVQVAWLAYPGGTGLQTMDYRITDTFMDPPQNQTTCYREQSIRLPDSWCCYDPLCDVPPVPERPNGPIRFGSLNNPCKLNEPLVRIWANVLRAVPDSRLVLQVIGQKQRDLLRALLSNMKIKPDRLDFVPRRDRPLYMRLYDLFDIGLDPLPYNGITTTCDALWMGVPVISLTGKTAAGRAGLSLLSVAGLPELVARDAGEFVQIAVDLANDPARLANLRSNLREKVRRSPVMDAPRFARNMEAAYRQMWHRWTSGSPVQTSTGLTTILP